MTDNRAKRIGKGLGNGLLGGLSVLGSVSMAMTDAPKRARLLEIDAELQDLLQERDHVIASMLEPGDLEISDDYDPYWRKGAAVQNTTDGRLTKCKGRNTISKYHEAHPACPYIEKIHTAHEFTLRD